jgi:hypothetical protein
MSLVHVEYPASCDHTKNSEQGDGEESAPAASLVSVESKGSMVIDMQMADGCREFLK